MDSYIAKNLVIFFSMKHNTIQLYYNEFKIFGSYQIPKIAEDA